MSYNAQRYAHSKHKTQRRGHDCCAQEHSERGEKRKFIKSSKCKLTLELDVNAILPLMEFLIAKGLISKEEFKEKKLKPENPLKDVNVNFTGEFNKDTLRSYYASLMRRGELYCELCGHPIEIISGNHPKALTMEHRHPKSKGGKFSLENIGPAHKDCNSIKTNILPEKWAKVGFYLLLANGITIDKAHTRYDYLTDEVKKYKRELQEHQR